MYYYAHSPLPVCDKVMNDTLIMTLAWQCNTITTTFCLYRQFHHVLCKITPLFPAIGLIFPTQMYFSLSFIKPCTTSDTDLFPEVAATSLVPGTFPAAGFQLRVFPTGEQTPSTGAEFLVPPHASISVFKFITIVSEGQWFDSSKPLLVPVFCGN